MGVLILVSHGRRAPADDAIVVGRARGAAPQADAFARRRVWVARPELPAMGVVDAIRRTTPFAGGSGTCHPRVRGRSERGQQYQAGGLP
jgi:hypothetical protein